MSRRSIALGLAVIGIASAGWLLLGCNASWCLNFDWQKARRVESFADCIRLGFPVGESYPRQCWAGRRVFREEIGTFREKSDLVRIKNLQPYQTVESPVVIEGEARGTWYFEAEFPIRLVDAFGNGLGWASAFAEGEWMTPDFVPFRATLYADPPTTDRGMLILKKSNPSGLAEHEDEMTFPVSLRLPPAAGETITIRIFFGNQRLSSGAADCATVFPVNREVPKSQAVARTALQELLIGPTGSEIKAGYFTTLNAGVALQHLAIERGIARVDFTAALDRDVGGSCRVAAIRAQIIETLRQFPSIRDVVISIDGRTEDILQP